MSTTKILIRLQNENAYWRHARNHSDVKDSPLYMDGTINGLGKAIKIVEDYLSEQQGKRPKISRWHAAELRRSCQAAVNALKRGERKRAIGFLEKVLLKTKA